jgi:hypothetical protein
MRESSQGRRLPQPVSVLIPAAVDGHADLGEQMVEKEATVASEIPEVFIVLVGLVSHFQSLLKGNGLGGLV